MSRILTMPEVGIIVDCLYHNSIKPKYEQKSLTALSAKCEVSKASLTRVRSILIEKKLLLIEGNRRTQTCCWNPDMCTPNPNMLLEIYRVYTKDVKKRVKVIHQKVKRLPSIEAAILAFKKAGWDEITLKKTVGNTTDIKIIDLIKVGVGE